MSLPLLPAEVEGAWSDAQPRPPVAPDCVVYDDWSAITKVCPVRGRPFALAVIALDVWCSATPRLQAAETQQN